LRARARSDPIGPDNEVGRHLGDALVHSRDPHATDSFLGISEETDHGAAVGHLGPSRQGSVDQHGVQNRPTRSVQCVDSVPRLDHYLGGFFTVVERGLPDGGCAGGSDGVQNTPAVKLEHTAPHERVGRQGVASMFGRVDDEDSQSLAGQKHRGGCSRTTCAGDDDVVTVLLDG
jgi:hypothetical protein